MPRLKLYTLTLTATFREKGTPGIVRTIPGACASENVSLAIDEGMSAAKRLFPVAEGWSEHNAVAIEIPSHLIEEIYTQEVNKNEHQDPS